jgi:tetratricopeptide (TPR) repeat protein
VERKLLEIASVYRYPVPHQAYTKRAAKRLIGSGENEVEIPTHETIESLASKRIMRVDFNGSSYTLHDIIQEHYYNEIGLREKRAYHLAAAMYYLETREDVHRIEVLHHLIKAEAHERAAGYATEKRNELFRSGHLEDILDLLNKIDTGILTPNLRLDIIMLQGDILARAKKYNEAAESYKTAMKMSGQMGDELARARSLYRLGDMLLEQGLSEEALACYKQGMSIVEFEGPSIDAAPGLRGIGAVMFQQGDYDEAKKKLEDSLALARKARDIQEAAKAVALISECLIHSGAHGEAKDFLTKNLRLLDVSGEHSSLARAYSNLGTIETTKGDTVTAMDYFEKGIHISRRNGLLRELGTALAQASVALMKKDESDRALSYIDEATELFLKLNDKRGQALTFVKQGEVHQIAKELTSAERAFKKGIQILREIEAKGELLEALKSYASMLEVKGDETQVKKINGMIKKMETEE